MCFVSEMRDIVPEETLKKQVDAVWYLQDLLLAYKYNMKDRFARDLNALKPFLNRFTFSVLEEVLEDSIYFMSSRKEGLYG